MNRGSSEVIAPKKVAEVEKEHKTTFLENFQMQMARFEAELSDRTGRKD